MESLLPEGHRARMVWGYVERQDLSAMYEAIKAREGGAGRSAIAPEILYALWVGSARGVARLTQEHDACHWIGGGVQVNYHTLSDFRVDHGEALDDLLTDSAATRMAARSTGFMVVPPSCRSGARRRCTLGAS